MSMIIGGVAALTAPSASARVNSNPSSNNDNTDSNKGDKCSDGKARSESGKCDDSNQGDKCSDGKARSESGKCDDSNDGDKCPSVEGTQKSTDECKPKDDCQVSSADTSSDLCPPVVDPCVETPNAEGCPTDNPPTPETPKSPETAVTTTQAQPATVEAVAVVSAPEAATVPEAVPVVEQPVPAVDVQPAKVPAAKTPVAATIPSAVNAGGGSSAPAGLPLWSVALMIAGLLGSVVAGSRLVATRKG